MLPHALIERFREFKYLLDNHSPILDQLVLARFIESRESELHVARMKKLYKKRQTAFIKCLDSYFPERHRVIGISTGLHLVAEFERIEFTDDLLERLEEAGVRVYPVEMHALNKGQHLNKVILGYGNLTEEEIVDGIKRLNNVLNPSFLDSHKVRV